jgi:hypothetical protein
MESIELAKDGLLSAKGRLICRLVILAHLSESIEKALVGMENFYGTYSYIGFCLFYLRPYGPR